MRRNRLSRFLTMAWIILLGVAGGMRPEARAQAARTMDAAEIRLALKKLNILGSVLYVAAHPDDENSALLAYLAKGRLVQTAYLSVTRGEGGQNLLGTEQGDLMGVLRTQELLAARRIDGAEQFFTRAIDFGYSKTSEETLRIWGEEKILSDVVWVVRKFRPDVIITRFSPTIGGHGNHTASAILAREAFDAAGDSTRFPDQLKYVRPWKATRLLFNQARFFADAPFDTLNSVSVDVGAYSPLLGTSFTEIAGESRSMHKSQGFGASPTRGSNVNYFQHTAGRKATTDLFDGIDVTWSRVPGAEDLQKMTTEALSLYDPENPSALIPHLLQIYRRLGELRENFWVPKKRQELADLIRACGGLWFDAIDSTYSVVPGGRMSVFVSALNRSSYPFILDSVALSFEGAGRLADVHLEQNTPVRGRFVCDVPFDHPLTQPYWLVEQGGVGAYSVSDQELVGTPENSPPFTARFYVNTGNGQLVYECPVEYRWTDPVEGERYRPIEITPPVSLNLSERVFVFPDAGGKKVGVTLVAGGADEQGILRIVLPKGWTARPQSIQFRLAKKGDERSEIFEVAPASGAASGEFRIEADIQGTTQSRGSRSIRYSHIPTQTVFPPASGKLLRIELQIVGQRIGYIMGAGDEVPAALHQMGFNVHQLTDEELASGNLSGYDAIVAGIRAYNTREILPEVQNRIMEYVRNGGTYVVQYVTLQRGVTDNLGPYPFSVSHDRVTMEEAPVSFMNPASPVLNFPNKIKEADFQGWVQERGLYFAERWDARYETPLACSDPGESSLKGGLLVAKYGKGYFVYDAYAFFRQLPGGVEGAYRLFANLVSLHETGKVELKGN